MPRNHPRKPVENRVDEVRQREILEASNELCRAPEDPARDRHPERGDELLPGPSREGKTRGDARSVARLLSLGVVSEGFAEDLLRKGLHLAGRMADADRARDYCSLMSMVLSAARLENDAIATASPVIGRPGLIAQSHDGSPLPPAYLEAASDDALRATADVLLGLGLLLPHVGAHDPPAVVDSPDWSAAPDRPSLAPGAN